MINFTHKGITLNTLEVFAPSNIKALNETERSNVIV